MSSQLPPFPVTTEDIVEQMTSQDSPKHSGRDSTPGHSEENPPPLLPKSEMSAFLSPNTLYPYKLDSRRSSLGVDFDSRRSSVAKVASDLKKGVRNVTDSTKKATNKTSAEGIETILIDSHRETEWDSETPSRAEAYGENRSSAVSAIKRYSGMEPILPKDDGGMVVLSTSDLKQSTNKENITITKTLVNMNAERLIKKVKDKTADVGTHVMVATVGARKWVASHTSKRAKAAMDQAKSGLSVGEKFTLFASEKISTLSRRGFTHVFMLLILIAYTALGALLFMACEAPHEDKRKIAITNERLILTEALWNKKSTDLNTFKAEVAELLVPYEDELYAAFSAGIGSNTEERVWTFWKAMFFCSTITTTIGYGHITPKTSAGKALTIVYALIGIPIFLIIMTDFGKLFTRLLKHLFLFLRRVYRSGTCKRARNHRTVKRWRKSLRLRNPSHSSSGDLTSVTTTSDLDKNYRGNISEDDLVEEEENLEEIEQFRRRVQEAKSIHRELSAAELQKNHNERNKIPISQSVPQYLLNFHYLDKVEEELEESLESPLRESTRNEENEPKPTISSNIEENPTQTAANKEKSKRSFNIQTDLSKKATGGIGNVKSRVFQRMKLNSDPEIGEKRDTENMKTEENGTTPVETDQSPVEDPSGNQDVDYFADDNFNLPVSLALFILILYMIIGCFIYITWEHWSFFEAFYFIFVSMTTIGFGDFVPEHPAYMMTTALYLVFGMVLTAMCINIIQEKLSHTFQEASTKLKESFNRLMEAAAAANTDDIDGPIVIGPPMIPAPPEVKDNEAEWDRDN